MKNVLSVLAIVSLTGCMSLDNLKPADIDTSYYRLDANSRMFCKGESNNCQDLTLLASSVVALSALQESYGQQINGSNNVRGLMYMLLQPKDKSYTATPLAGKRYQYRLPINERTEHIWRLLSKTQTEVYGSSNAQ